MSALRGENVAKRFGALTALRDVNLLQRGAITFDKRSADTSLEELTELVVAEYRSHGR